MQDIAIRIHATGGPEVLEAEALNLSAPAPGEVRVRHTAIGVNYVDIYQRSGKYGAPALPFIPGAEAAGVVEALGDGVTEFATGQRVAYSRPFAGCYASAANVPAPFLVPLPDKVPDDIAAVSMLKGITAHMLFAHNHPLRAGETLLVHAAAGGLGLLLTQWAKALGVRVIGTVGSREKAELALAHGLDHAILYHEEDFVAATLALTDGQGVHFAVDGIGGDTLKRTLQTVRTFGMVASVGEVAGAPGGIAVSDLGPKHPISLSRPSVFNYMRDPAWYRAGALTTLAHLERGLKLPIGEVLPLRAAAQAQRKLESGTTTGALLLRP